MGICNTAALQLLCLIAQRSNKRVFTLGFKHAGLSAYTLNQSSCFKRCYSDKSLINDLLNVVKQTEGADKFIQKPIPGSSKLIRSPRQTSSPNKRMQQLLPHMFSAKGELLPTVSVEEQLKGLMQIWEMEDAVELLKRSVRDGAEPDKNVILDLLQQLANLGEVDCLLALHEFLKDRGLTTNLRFYHCLRDAYFNSGRIEEGVIMLRMIYHSTRDFDDADMLFTLLATMTIKHFEHHLPVIEKFVEDLEESDPPVPSARASLWRCLVLAEKFNEADAVLQDCEEVEKMVPAQVTKLIHSPLEMDYDRDSVLIWLLELPYIKPGLKASVFDELIRHKSNEGDWYQALEYLSSALEQGMKVHQHTVQTFLTRFLSHLSQDQIQHLSDWANSLDTTNDSKGS